MSRILTYWLHRRKPRFSPVPVLAEMVGGAWDGYEIKPGAVGQELQFPSNTACLHVDEVAALYRFDGAKWRFVEFRECSGKGGKAGKP